VRRTRFDDAPCPIARTTDLLGDWWTPVIMREVFGGARRFDEFERRLGVSRNTLTRRLDRLVDEGLLQRVPYQDHPPRDEYRPTEKGMALWPVLAAMWRFGDDWLFGDRGAPVELADRATGATIRPVVVDETTGAPVDVRKLKMRRATSRRSP
jgi:DNA-binding HxlR family transcriptional regulator